MKLNYRFRLSERNKIIVLLVFLLATVFLLIFLVIIPCAEEIKKTKKKVKEQRMEIEEKYLAGINAKLLSGKAPEINKKMEKVEKVLVNPDNQLEFVTSLEKLAKKNNIKQTPNIEYNSGEELDFARKIPLKLFTQGRLSDQLVYLKGLKSLRYYLEINSIKMKVIPASDLSSDFSSDASEKNVSLFIEADS